MKKIMKSALAVTLAVAMLITGTTAFAASGDNSAIISASETVNLILNGLFSVVTALFPKADYPSVDEYFEIGSENFYKGTEEFLDAPAENAKWSLGFGKASIIPEGLRNSSKSYYTGGYFTQKISEIYDDQGTNAIAMSDGSGRGTAIFASIDGIGVGNADIRAIRAAVVNKLEEKDIENDIISININSTHCHTVIDTQGFNLDMIPKVFRNMFSFLPGVEPARSLADDFIDTMIDGTAEAIVAAYTDMHEGKLYYFETVGIGRDDEKGLYKDDEYSYLTNKRYDEEGYQNFIACFKFVPDDAAVKPTVFANLGAHPTTIDRSNTALSADFPHYMEVKVSESGMNFMFIQGAQSPVSVKKTAVQTEEILAKVAAESETDPYAPEYNNAKTLGYEFGRLVLEAQANATEVAPLLNIEMRECAVKLDRGLFQIAAASQLLGFTTVFDEESQSGYSIITETGYIEIGTDIVMLSVPGELVPQLVFGNVVGADEAYLETDWELDATAEIIRKNAPEKKVLVMGLSNDAIGYIIPDNDYAPFIADSLWGMEIGNWKLGEELFGEYHRHYEETLATGSTAASTIISVLNGIAEDRNK